MLCGQRADSRMVLDYSGHSKTKVLDFSLALLDVANLERGLCLDLKILFVSSLHSCELRLCNPIL